MVVVVVVVVLDAGGGTAVFVRSIVVLLVVVVSSLPQAARPANAPHITSAAAVRLKVCVEIVMS
ncbi:MAG: hypothetical protein WA943_02700 [Parvibaculum sp.]|uniref:hypothetical protein n=1 Tax=Parvibaculum sp. TaxID=2024848 RepID=UPI003C771CCB